MTLLSLNLDYHSGVWFITGQFHVEKVVPQADGSSSKVKVKVRVNVHGIFSVSSASLVEVHKSDDSEEPMDTDQALKDEEVLLLSSVLELVQFVIHVHY